MQPKSSSGRKRSSEESSEKEEPSTKGTEWSWICKPTSNHTNLTLNYKLKRVEEWSVKDKEEEHL